MKSFWKADFSRLWWVQLTRGNLSPVGRQGGPAAGDQRRLSMTESWEATPELRRACCPGAALVGAGSGQLSYASVLGPLQSMPSPATRVML